MEKSNSSKLLNGMSSQTVITIIMGVLSIVSFSLFSRNLTKEDFGYFAALSAILVIFEAFSEAGFGSAIIQKKDCSKEYFSTAFTLSIFISTSLSIILFISAPFLSVMVSDETIIKPLRFFSIILVLKSIESVGRASMMRNLLFLKYGIYQIISYCISYSIGVFMAIKGYGLYSLVVAAVLNSLFSCTLVFSTGTRIPKLLLKKSCCKEIVNFGGWLTAGVLTNQLTHQLDKLVLSKWLSVVALGAYSRPSSFVNQITERINGIFDTALFPILSSIQDDAEKVKGTFTRAISLLNSISSVLALCFFFNAELIIQIFFGVEWMELVPVLRVVSMGVIFAIDQRLIDCYFRSLALVKQNFILRLFCMFLMLVSLFIGAKNGIVGTAISVVLANLVAVIIKMWYLCVKINVSGCNVIKSFVVSLKPCIFLLVLGVPFLLFVSHDNIWNNLIFAFMFGCVIIYEFIFSTGMVSSEYSELVRPYIDKFKKFKRNEYK